MIASAGHREASARVKHAADWLRVRLQAGARLHADSRRVQRGDAFFAWPGHDGDGRAYIAAARERGAAAIVVDEPGLDGVATDDLYRISGLRECAGEIASIYYGEPAAQLDLIAVTGTNGKTSCSNWIAQGLARRGQRCALIGTLGSGLLDQQGRASLAAFGLTMPDALQLHALLADFAAAGASAVVMEASSIGLHQHRLSGAQPRVAVFTNLSRDHLDYHGTLEAYTQAKLMLFQTPGLRAAILNATDPVSLRAIALLDPRCRAIAYGERTLDTQGREIEHLLAAGIEEHAHGLRLDLDGDFGRASVNLAMLGRFNAHNALAVASSWLALGWSLDEVAAQLEGLRPVAGRMEIVRVPPAYSVVMQPEKLSTAAECKVAPSSGHSGSGPLPCTVVDYAHTPDALSQALDALRPLARARGGKLWCVFGAGGERDAGKRPLMGAAASGGADLIIVTSDNPRSEDPGAIAAQVAAGLDRPAFAIELDRRQAIALALQSAQPADVVLIAGKGHERWQEIAGERLGFDDVAEASAVLSRIAEAARA